MSTPCQQGMPHTRCSVFDHQLHTAEVSYRLADEMERQASRPHLGDELTSRVETLRRRSAGYRQQAEQQAREAFRYALYFQLAS